MAPRMPSQNPHQVRVLRDHCGNWTWKAFSILCSSHLLAAAYSPIQDCDEVFNFWEPTHYLNHGFGLQTWELSPEYAIRSWLYTAIHAVPIHLASWIPFLTDKTAEFFFLRIVFAIVSASCETHLFTKVARFMSPRIAWFFVLIVASSAGLFHASVSYLPSSFALYTSILGAASFLDRSESHNVARGLGWFAFGTIIGWPFVGALALPFAFGEVVLSYNETDMAGLFWRFADGACRALMILTLEIVVDSFFYRRLVCVPFNIVWYNVFSKGKGPNTYGTELWHFYVRNLLINFNFWLVLSMLALPLLLLQRSFAARRESRLGFVQSLTMLSAFYLWLAIFTAQPHKEERFMYPAYPFLVLNAAFSLHVLLLNLGAIGSVTRATSARIRLFSVFAFTTLAIGLGLWRIVGLVTAYSAPLSLYSSLQATSSLGLYHKTPVNLCVGKEWYRFASSYHLPSHARLRFIKSEFSGLLPGAFSESESPCLGNMPGTYLIPKDMNDENLEDMGKYNSLDSCDYIVDSSFGGSTSTALEPDFVGDSITWETVSCLPFLDAGRTGLLGRVFWVPKLDIVPRRYRRVWGHYCLLRRRQKARPNEIETVRS